MAFMAFICIYFFAIRIDMQNAFHIQGVPTFSRHTAGGDL